jgi:5-methylcytosine-specific restriction endonuclease McrA
MKNAITKLLGDNGVQIDHINSVSNDSSDKAYRYDNLQYMLSSENNKKGG